MFPLNSTLTLHYPSADVSSASTYTRLWTAYEGLKQLQNTLYFSFYMYWRGSRKKNYFFLIKKRDFSMFCRLCRVRISSLHTDGVFSFSFSLSLTSAAGPTPHTTHSNITKHCLSWAHQYNCWNILVIIFKLKLSSFKVNV